jgi:hypothetical protein
MKKIRLIFVGLIFLIFIVAIFVLNRFQFSLNPEIGKVSPFQITQIAGNGKIFKNADMTAAVDIKALKLATEINLRSDLQTSFEFIYAGFAFTALPGSHLYCDQKTKELHFYSGELYWNRLVPKGKLEVALGSSGELLGLSDRGRLKINDASLVLWNYAGESKFDFQDETYHLKPNQALFARQNYQPRTFDILPPPEYISPEDKVIQLSKPADSIVKFSWKSVRGASTYFLRIYTSRLREDMLFERVIASNRLGLDLLRFEGINEIFWQVFPYDSVSDFEGTPSQIGHIKLMGAVLDREEALKPPRLEIKSLTVSGNMVLIKGEGDKNSRLYVNDEEIQIDMDDKFIHTLTFKTIGIKGITFRLISPSEIETVVTRQVSIFEE